MSMHGSSNGVNGRVRPPLSSLELRSPPLPQTLVEAMDLINQPDQLEMEPVTTMVERDPIVVARLLQIVNSAYYGLQRSIDSVERAVVMLGPVAVTGIVMGMNMLKLRSALEGPASRLYLRLIRHSIATAFLTRHLIEGPPRLHVARPKARNIGASFTAGLLHDFGKIILVYNYPDDAVELYERQTYDQQILTGDMRGLEQLLFGCDHTEAGEYVARKLGFPDALTEVIRLHHDFDRDTGDDNTNRLLRATAAANMMAKAIGYSFTHKVAWRHCRNHPLWETIITTDLPRFESLDDLFAELDEEREHLDYYVQNLTSTTLSDVKNPG